jgi:hypothetical protein
MDNKRTSFYTTSNHAVSHLILSAILMDKLIYFLFKEKRGMKEWMNEMSIFIHFNIQYYSILSTTPVSSRIFGISRESNQSFLFCLILLFLFVLIVKTKIWQVSLIQIWQLFFVCLLAVGECNDERTDFYLFFHACSSFVIYINDKAA